MIRILQRGGIHRTKFEFGLFNRKHKPKHNKKRALIVHRGVYSATARLFACGGRPTHVRKMKDLRKPPIIQRQGLKRLCRVMSRRLREVSQRDGFVRRLLTPASDPLVDTGEKPKGWNIWELKGLPFNKTMKVKVDTGGRTLEPGEAVICNPDGTYTPFKGASITMRSETGGDDFIEVLRGVFSVPKELIDDKPKHQSIGYIPKGKISMAELRNLEPIYGLPELPIPPASEVQEPLNAPRGWELVEFIDVKLASGPREVQEGDVERKTSETVNKTDTDKEPNNG